MYVCIMATNATSAVDRIDILVDGYSHFGLLGRNFMNVVSFHDELN